MSDTDCINIRIAPGRKIYRSVTFQPYTCPHESCGEIIFNNGVIKQLTCPKCKGFLMLVRGSLEKWTDE